LLLSLAAIGVHHLTLGPKESSMSQLRRNRMILTMTKLSMTSHSLSILLLTKISCRKTLTKAAVLRDQVSPMVQFTNQLDPGTRSQLICSQRMSTGVIWTVEIICRGLRTSTFHATVAHAGHKAQQVRSLTDSTF
jgi:hypothetical protein